MIIDFFACDTAFFTASGTFADLPFPIPNSPLPLPTTTVTANLKVRPPFITFATLETFTVLSRIGNAVLLFVEFSFVTIKIELLLFLLNQLML